MKKLIMLVAFVALLISVMAATCEPSPTPTPAPIQLPTPEVSVPAPGAYVPGIQTIKTLGVVTSGTWNATSLAWAYHARDTNLTVNTGNARVGIGTTEPKVALDVRGSSHTGTVASGTWQGSSVTFTYMQLTRGMTDLLAGAVAASVTHNLAATPFLVILSWKDVPTPGTASDTYLFANAYDATTFTINVSKSLTDRPSIAWLAIP